MWPQHPIVRRQLIETMSHAPIPPNFDRFKSSRLKKNVWKRLNLIKKSNRQVIYYEQHNNSSAPTHLLMDIV